MPVALTLAESRTGNRRGCLLPATRQTRQILVTANLPGNAAMLFFLRLSTMCGKNDTLACGLAPSFPDE
jgi:hypothetical protein